MPVRDTAVYELAKEVGSVFQNPKSQFFHLDTDSELEFGLENEGVPPEQIYTLDEPTANLDAEAIEKLRKQIGRAHV